MALFAAAKFALLCDGTGTPRVAMADRGAVWQRQRQVLRSEAMALYCLVEKCKGKAKDHIG